MWLAAAFLSALFAGITAILAKTGIQNTDSDIATALRTSVIAVFSCLIVLFSGAGKGLFTIESRSLVFLILSGLATGFSWLCYFRALSLGNVNKVVAVDKLSTVLAVIAAFLFLQEPVSWYAWGGAVLLTAGTLLMIQKKEEQKRGGGRWLLYALLSALFAALTSILGKIGVENVDSNLGTAIRTCVVLLMAWLICIVQKKVSLVRKIEKKSMRFILLSGITGGLSWLCYYYALKYGKTTAVIAVDKLSVVLTIVFARVLLKERLNKRAVLGTALLSLGVLAMIF